MLSSLGQLLPKSLVWRVYTLYSATLLLFVSLGLGLFYHNQFTQQIEDAQQSAVMLVEIAALTVGDAAVIGDYDTIKRTLDKAILRSQFNSAMFIDIEGGIIKSQNSEAHPNRAPTWLRSRVEAQLYDVNRNIAVGGQDYGVLRLSFSSETVANSLWDLILIAVALASLSALGGLLLIWFPLQRWLGKLEQFRTLDSTASPNETALRAMIDEVPFEFRHLFETLAKTSDSLRQELASRESALDSLHSLLDKMVPDMVAGNDSAHNDLTALTSIVSELVTEREASRLALNNQKFALDQHAIVAIAEPDGKIVYANDKFCTSTGYTRQELSGRRLFAAGPHPASFYADIWQTISAGKVWQGEICDETRDGSLLWYASTIVPLPGQDGRAAQFIAISTDISTRKQAESLAQQAQAAAEAANRAKSEFLANMSHEIRTPMNGIIGMAQLALDSELPPTLRDYLQTISSSADALLTIINDILDFSKIEAGMMLIEPIPCNLRTQIAELLRPLQFRAEEKGLRLACNIAPDLPPWVLADPGRLRQILINLIGNAIKFTERGEVVLNLRYAPAASLLVSVQDTGIGIAEEKQAAIFNAFTQEDSSITRKYGGTGLGLSISNRLIELMGGQLWLESTPGVGSTFHFTLTCRPVAPPADAALNEEFTLQPQAGQNGPTSHKLLLVEDNLINQRVALALLNRAGYRAEVASNGCEALAALAVDKFSLILMDMQMPVMDGLEATRAIRRQEAEAGSERIPIVAMTANAMQGDRDICLAAGMDDYISKPINATQLIACLKRWCEPRAAESPLRN